MKDVYILIRDADLSAVQAHLAHAGLDPADEGGDLDPALFEGDEFGIPLEPFTVSVSYCSNNDDWRAEFGRKYFDALKDLGKEVVWVDDFRTVVEHHIPE